LITSALSIAALYLLVNLALLRVLTPEEIAGRPSALGDALGRLVGPGGAKAVLVVAMLACLGSVSSMVPAAVRVTFALSRDGLTFRFMSRMSKSQAPVGALLVVAGFALVLVTQRDFASAPGIYYMVSTVLFGLAYASLIVFRFRESRFPEKAFRCPVGPVLAAVLIVVYLALAVNIAVGQGRDALLVGAGLALFVPLYFVWKRFAKPAGSANSP
jgi:APA family basic amino acid/polyamine antiporter